MGLNIVPEFRLIANDQNVTDTIRDRFRSLRLTDEAGTTSDTLEITLADHDPQRPIKLPETGAELELSLGYDGTVRKMGLFVCDEIELHGPPSQMTIRARAAPYEKTPKGKASLQTQKSRSWKNGTTIGAMVKKIAKEHGMEAAVSPALAKVVLPHYDQSNESDMNLLYRIAKKYDAIAKPAGGKLVFTKRGDSKSATGQDLPRTEIEQIECSTWRVTIAKRDTPGTVVAYYRDKRAAQRRFVKIGDGDPVKRLRNGFKNAAEAKAAAEAEQSRQARAEHKLSLTLPGNPDLIAESIVVLSNFRDGVDGEWIVTHAEHYIGSQGYRSTLDCERPNANKDVAEAQSGAVEDEVQSATEEGGSAGTGL